MSDHQIEYLFYSEDLDAEFTIWINFDFQPYEPRTWDYPGCEASADISSVEFEDGTPAEVIAEVERMKDNGDLKLEAEESMQAEVDRHYNIDQD